MSTFIDFSPGKLYWNCFNTDVNSPSIESQIEDTTYGERMIVVRYHNNITLEVGWYARELHSFIIRIAQDDILKESNRALFERRCKTIEELTQLLIHYTAIIREMLRHELLGEVDFYPGHIRWNLFNFDPTLSLDNANPYLVKDMLNVSYKNATQLEVHWQRKKNNCLVMITEGTRTKVILEQQECSTLDTLKNTLKTYVSTINNKLYPEDE